MASRSNKLVFGGMVFGAAYNWPEFGGDEASQKLLTALKNKDISHIDTAQLYGQGTSEKLLGHLDAIGQGFVLDTKWVGGWAGEAWATKANVVQTAQKSFTDLNAKRDHTIDVFYLHSPDHRVPVEETLDGVQEAYQEGIFKRFGLSNFTAAEVKEVIDVCKRKGYVLPTVYQGNYSAVARKIEDELFPLLRENNIAFYAYSPIAGGFLTKDRKFVEEQQGRFAEDALFGIYHKLYKSENFLNLLDEWQKIAESEGISKAELAFRWINYHSLLKPEAGDAVIFGASKFSQVDASVDYLRAGPLSDKAAKSVDDLWSMIKNDAIIDNFQAVFGGSA